MGIHVHVQYATAVRNLEVKNMRLSFCFKQFPLKNACSFISSTLKPARIGYFKQVVLAGFGNERSHEPHLKIETAAVTYCMSI